VIARNSRRNPKGLQAASGALCAAALLVGATARVEGVPPAALIAGLIPTAAGVLLLVLVPIPARRLRAVGWTLVTTSAVTMAVLVAVLR
jgi:hypothetical protein